MSEWFVYLGVGFLLGSFFQDAIWKVLHRQTSKLIDVQREHISELERLLGLPQ